MTFPAVTICNNNAVMMNKLLTNDELKEMVYGTTDTSNSANSNNVTNPAPVDGMYCFFRAMLCISAAYPVARCPSVRHVLLFYRNE